jgi:hypothetical protein
MERLSPYRLFLTAAIGLLISGLSTAGADFDPIGNLQPVVLTGDSVGALTGMPVGEIWAYRYDSASAAFVQVPVQIDERALYDVTVNIPGGPWDPVYELTYDWLGVDDGLLDDDDEIALMARDAGDRAPDTDLWVSLADDVRIEIRMEDPLGSGTGYLYLFTSPLISDANPSFFYVTYLTTDPVAGAAEVETPVYRIDYEGRWRLTGLEVKPHLDLLDRVKARAYGIVGSETEETFQQTSLLLGERSGKVRALREVQGAASGPGTTHIDVFYRDVWLRILNLRVHAMPNIWYYLDYAAPEAAGHFYSSHLPAGLTLDGVNDAPADDAWPSWSQVSLPEGTLVSYHRELTPFPVREGAACTPDAGMTFYWRDDASFNDLSGDDTSAYGNHGIHLQCTADTNTEAYSSRMTHYPLPPQDPYASIGNDYAQREENPLTITTEAQTRAELTDADIHAVERAGDGRLAFHWVDALGEDGYEIYRGDLVSPFAYGHDAAVACGLPAGTITWSSPDDQETGQPSYYYLVVPRRGSSRAYGTDSAGDPRPPAAMPCP